MYFIDSGVVYVVTNWISYNPNPIYNNRVGDCAIRAISKALEQDWETTYTGLTMFGFIRCDLPNANHVWGAYLKSKGFKRYIIDDEFYTVDDFCKDNPQGTYILSLDGHVVCVMDGHFYDTWDCGAEIPIYYWRKG